MPAAGCLSSCTGTCAEPGRGSLVAGGGELLPDDPRDELEPELVQVAKCATSHRVAAVAMDSRPGTPRGDTM
jgi:hypothetical protein